MKHNKSLSLFCLLFMILFSCKAPSEQAAGSSTAPEPFDYALVLHGGAGNMNFENVPESNQEIYKHALDSALQLGLDVLKAGGPSIDAVEVVIRCLEDNPLFNAGKGAVFTNEGKNELDASIMKGQDLNAGAVAGVTDIKNPISAARAVMERSEHVMLAGRGASVFARQQGLEIVDPSYFSRKDALNHTRGQLQGKSMVPLAVWRWTGTGTFVQVLLPGG